MAQNVKLLIAVVLSCSLHPTAEARIERSQSAKVEFKLAHPCPTSGERKGPCKGYVIDHVWPLACGGEDHPRNMQWQNIEEAKAKDKWERKMCGGQ